MDHDFYGREGKGPGAYLKTDFVATSPTKIASKYSMPKNDRGLLSPKRITAVPGPANYETDISAIKLRKYDGACKMGNASRDISFSKYGAVHSHIVAKGLY
jgi:hypothetical protein